MTYEIRCCLSVRCIIIQIDLILKSGCGIWILFLFILKHVLFKQWIILVAGYGGCVELELEGLNKNNGFVQQRYGTSKYYKGPDIRAAIKVI